VCDGVGLSAPGSSRLVQATTDLLSLVLIHDEGIVPSRRGYNFSCRSESSKY